MVNKVDISGRLVEDAQALADKGIRFRIAYDTGDYKAPTGFISCTYWYPENYTGGEYKKGEQVHLTGSLGFNQWESKDKSKRQEVTIRVESL